MELVILWKKAAFLSAFSIAGLAGLPGKVVLNVSPEEKVPEPLPGGGGGLNVEVVPAE
jgi:hypothetical protein